MENQSFSEEVRRYMDLVWRWAWLLALVTLAAGISAYFISRRLTPVYQATARVLVNEAPNSRSTDYASVLTSERLARTYAELLVARPVLEQLVEDKNLLTTYTNLRSRITVTPVRDTQLIDVSVEDTDPVRAAATANDLVNIFILQNQARQSERYQASINSLDAQISSFDGNIAEITDKIDALGDDPDNDAERTRLEATLTQYNQIRASLLQSLEQVRLAESSSMQNLAMAEEAIAPRSPIRPRALMNAVVASLISLALAIGGIFLHETLDDSLSPDMVSRQFGLPILGVIARHATDGASMVVKTQPRSPVSEAFRSLRTNIQFASVDKPVHTLLVTSPSPEDGKSTVAANLSISLAQSGLRVALVEADLRRPQVHKKMNLPNRYGLSSVFVQPQSAVNGALQKTEVSNLMAITSGELPPNPAELLGSGRMSDILGQLGKHLDMIVLDTPPVLVVTDSAVLATRVDGVLMVVKPGKTKQAAFRQAIEQLNRVGANILGVVLNDVEVKSSRYRYSYYRNYYYTYHKYYGHEKESTQPREAVS
jgi:non-specific protein-tyrosine kinase